VFEFLKNLSWAEWLVIGIVLFLVFGGKRMVDTSRRLGHSTKELKKVKQELTKLKEEVV